MENINLLRMQQIEAIPNLKFRAISLSNEGIGDLVKIITKIFTDKINKFISIFKSNTIDNKALNNSAKPLTKLDKDINFINKNFKYSSIYDIEVPSITGLKVDMLNNVSILEDSIDNINKILLPYLDKLDEVISKMIADEDYRNSFSPKNDFNIIFTENNKLVENIDNLIDPKSHKDIYKVKELYPNITSIEMVKDSLLKINKKINDKDILKINEIVNKISNKIETLYDMLSEGDITKSTKSSINNLAEGIEDCANYITNTSAIYHILNQTNNTFVKSIDNIKKYGKKS